MCPQVGILVGRSTFPWDAISFPLWPHPHVVGLRHKLTARTYGHLNVCPPPRTVQCLAVGVGGEKSAVPTTNVHCHAARRHFVNSLACLVLPSVRGTTNSHHGTSSSLSLSTHSCSHQVDSHMESAHDFPGEYLTTQHWLAPGEGTSLSESATWSSDMARVPSIEWEKMALGGTITIDFTVGVFHIGTDEVVCALLSLYHGRPCSFASSVACLALHTATAMVLIHLSLINQVDEGTHNDAVPFMVARQGWLIAWDEHMIVYGPS